MKKDFLSVAAIFLTICLFTGCDNNEPSSGIETVVNNLNYELNSSDFTATLTGPVSSQISVVNIPSEITYKKNTYTVTAIGSGAFQGTSLTKVEIPNTIKTIGNGAFNSCHSLTSIRIPSSVTSIGCLVVDHCTNLTNLTIEDGNTTLSWDTSAGLDNMRYIKIENIYLGRNLTTSLCYQPTKTLTVGKYVKKVSLTTNFSAFNLDIKCYPTTPPELSTPSVIEAYKVRNFKLYVPSGSINAYKDNVEWGKFANIYGF